MNGKLEKITNAELMTSRELALIMNIDHSKVLRKIRNVLKQIDNKEFSQANYVPGNYIDIRGKVQPEIVMTKIGVDYILSRTGYLTGNDNHFYRQKKEQRFVEMLTGMANQNEYVIENLIFSPQYPILNYSVDLAAHTKRDSCETSIELFEYDEEYHNLPDQIKKDSKRMSEITNELKKVFNHITLYRIPEGCEYEFIYGYLCYQENLFYISDEWENKFVKY